MSVFAAVNLYKVVKIFIPAILSVRTETKSVCLNGDGDDGGSGGGGGGGDDDDDDDTNDDDTNDDDMVIKTRFCFDSRGRARIVGVVLGFLLAIGLILTHMITSGVISYTEEASIFT